ncbi:MAG: hypothetical protein ACR2IK_11325 [Chloroflexota bacterium]
MEAQRASYCVRAIHDSPALAPDGSQVAFAYDGGQVLGDGGPTTEWRLAVHPLPDTAGHYWTGVNPGEKLQWAGGMTGVLFVAGGFTGPQVLRVALRADAGTLRTIDRLSSSGLTGFDWHS